MTSCWIASVVGDRGGAEALAPVLETLRRRRELAAIIAEPRGGAVLAERGIVSHPAVDPDGWLDQIAPSLLLTTTSWANPPVELAFIEAARSRDVPTVAVIDFWSNYRRRFESGSRTIWPDVIVVPDELALAEARADGIPADRLVALGNPHYEELLARHHGADQRIRVAFREHVGIRRNATLVLFASQPLQALYGETLGYDERDVLDLVHRAVGDVAQWLGHPVDLAVRPHPRELTITPPETNRWVRTRLANGGEPMSWVLAADLVVGMNSAVLLQAAMLGARVVSVQPGLRMPDPLPSNRLGLTDGIYDRSEVAAGLYRALARPAHTQTARVLHRMQRSAVGSTSRVVALIHELARQTAVMGQ